MAIVFNAVHARRFLLLLVLTCLSACSSSQPEAPQVELSGQTMGTTYSIKYLPGVLEVEPEDLRRAVDERLAGINSAMSTYDQASELSRLNRAPVGKFFNVSNDLMTVLEAAQNVYNLSKGAFDPSVGPLVNLWGFGPDVVIEYPGQEVIKDRLRQVGYHRLQIDTDVSAVRRTGEMYIDLSAIAKGYAVDQIASLLESRSITNYLVEIGGELRAAGHNSRHTPWQIAIEKPAPGMRKVHAVLEVSGMGMATSGDYRNFFEREGRRFSHTLDPRTGYPVSHSMVSVTVLAGDCMLADALATAFMVMGAKAGLALAEEEGIAVWFIEDQGGKLVDTLSTKMLSYRVN